MTASQRLTPGNYCRSGAEAPVCTGANLTEHHHPPHGEHSAHAVPAAVSLSEHKSASAGQHDGAHDHGGHDKHAGHSVAMFRDKFWISLLLTMPTLVWGHMLQNALGYSAPVFSGSHWIPAVFGTAVFLYGGTPFLQGAVRELRDRLPGMMTLIALAVSVAFVYSAAVALGYPGVALWEELATLVTIMLLGHWIEMRTISQAQGALKELAKLIPATAVRLNDAGQEEEVLVANLAVEDLVLIRPGERIPADGIVVEGSSSVNEAVITGESQPVAKTTGTKVIAGSVNGSGSLRVKVTGTGEGTAVAGIMRLVEQAQRSRSRAQALADRAARFLTIVALVAGVATVIAWILVRPGDTSFAIERMVTVLVVACPHALGLAIPLVIAISTTLGAQSGLLVRDRRGLEEARNLTTVVFDKTGTLTVGEFGVVDVVTNDWRPDDALRIAASLELDSEHSIAQGIVRSAREKGLSFPQAEDFEAIPGKGARARVDGREFFIGGPALLRMKDVELPASFIAAQDAANRNGQAAIFLLDGDTPVACFVVADVVREESKAAIQSLHNAGIEVIMMTGDAESVANGVAQAVGIDRVFAEVLPEEKAGRIAELQAAGKRVAMVGDGVNDAPALVQANVGIAIGAGTDVAVEAGDIVLMRSDPRDVARIVQLSRITYRKMIQNLWWAAGYNILAIPLAAGVLASQGFVLSPAIAAVLMSASTVIVAANAQLLRRVRLN
jgi:Cu2+-exporting ATPase